MTDFLWDISELEILILSGFAGTGKSSLIGAFVKTLDQIKIQTVLMAPTGRAAKVLSNFSSKPASTIHRSIYFHATKPDGSAYMRLFENKKTNCIFIVDEASMVSAAAGSFGSRDILQDLIEFIYSSNNCKLIFVGDEGQLPPVGVEKSPALDSVFLQKVYGFKVTKVQLNQIVRQEAKSGILDLSLFLRKWEEEIPILPINGSDTISINGTELQDELESCISKYGQQDVMVITRSNKRANLFNEQIRRRIMWQEDELNAGDVMMCVNNNYFWLEPTSEAGFLANGEMLEIKKIIRREEIFGCQFADVIVSLADYPNMGDIELKLLTDTIHKEAPSMPRNELAELFHRIGREEYPEERTKKKRNKKVMENPYFQAVQVKFGYAVTCHKAQGGQWEAVFVDQGYFLSEMWDEEYMRWLYTAVTRAKSKLYLLNFSEALVGLRQ
jgi:exodeoxyribonuclease V